MLLHKESEENSLSIPGFRLLFHKHSSKASLQMAKENEQKQCCWIKKKCILQNRRGNFSAKGMKEECILELFSSKSFHMLLACKPVLWF